MSKAAQEWVARAPVALQVGLPEGQVSGHPPLVVKQQIVLDCGDVLTSGCEVPQQLFDRMCRAVGDRDDLSLAVTVCVYNIGVPVSRRPPDRGSFDHSWATR